MKETSVVLYLLWMVLSQAFAESPAKPMRRPRVGLVLEGGGALGFAHIGVIEWLEEHQIPVDYVAGTSMGGLVAGLYASGESPDEIKQFVSHIDWSLVLSGQLPFSRLAYRRKEDQLAFPNRLEFGIKHGISSPGGLNSGSAVRLLFDGALLPYYDLRSFDDLPIPFRCVATEITTGQEHVFSNGSLPQALRATMSIPAVFTPVHDGTNIYSDGGAVDNLPVDIVRKMGAEIVIAVYLDPGKPDPSSFTSPLSIAGRNVAIMIAANERKSLERADILLTAHLDKFAALEFDRNREIMPAGRRAAEESATPLERLSLSHQAWESYLTNRNSRRRTKIPAPESVDVEGLTPADAAGVKTKLEPYVGKPLDLQKLEETIADLEGQGLYSGVSYYLRDEGGRPALNVHPERKSFGPPFLNLGVNLLSTDSNNLSLGVGGRVTFVDLAGHGSEIRTDFSLGQLAGAGVELYRPIFHDSRWFLAPRAYVFHEVAGFFSGSEQLAQYKGRHNGVGGDVGYAITASDQLRVGVDQQWLTERRTIGSPISQEFSFTPTVSSVRYTHLGQNDATLPTRGTFLQARYSFFSSQPRSSDSFSQGFLQASHYLQVSTPSSLFLVTQLGVSSSSGSLGLAGFHLGGPLLLSSYDRYELLGKQMQFGQAGYLRRLFKLNPIVGDAAFVTGLLEVGHVSGMDDGSSRLGEDAAGAFVLKTLIGPLYAGGSIGDSGHRKWFFGIGRVL